MRTNDELISMRPRRLTIWALMLAVIAVALGLVTIAAVVRWLGVDFTWGRFHR